MSVGEILLEQGKLKPEHLQTALATCQDGERLDRALVRLGYVAEQDVLEVWGRQLRLPVVDLSSIRIDAEAVRAVPSKVVHRRRLVPIRLDGDTLQVATSEPFDIYAFDELRMMTGYKIAPTLAAEAEIDRVIKEHYGVGGETVSSMIEESEDVELVSDIVEENGDLFEMAQEASVVKLVNEILVEALNKRATDIHIEPLENDLRIRYRVDGVMHDQVIPPQIRRFQAAIISRIKILAQMNIAEKRLPQDGSFKVRVHGREVDIRVSVIPMQFGEGVVLRILDKQSLLLSLTDLGMEESCFERFKHLIEMPHGIMLVTGPTGSGKTTTLYAALAQIVSPTIKVLTIEEPVEYNLPGVNQVPVNTKIGLTFAHGLRSFLRHDPDVIMVGEIRDKDTAEVAIQASLTGHLVFSTLHTNDAATAATRLLDMGVEPFLVASTVEGVMAQRLVRKVCPSCKQQYQPDAALLPPDFEYDGRPLWRGVGCRECHDSGYLGRVGVFELLRVDSTVRELIMARASTEKIIEAGRANGLALLREDGWHKVLAGVTTPEEVVRVTKA